MSRKLEPITRGNLEDVGLLGRDAHSAKPRVRSARTPMEMILVFQGSNSDWRWWFGHQQQDDPSNTRTQTSQAHMPWSPFQVSIETPLIESQTCQFHFLAFHKSYHLFFAQPSHWFWLTHLPCRVNYVRECRPWSPAAARWPSEWDKCPDKFWVLKFKFHNFDQMVAALEYWLIGTKLFRPNAYPTSVSSKHCLLIVNETVLERMEAVFQKWLD